MKFNAKKFLKGSLISLAVLGMIGGSMNNNVVNAKHRHVFYKRRIKHTRRHSRRNRLYNHHNKIRNNYHYHVYKHASNRYNKRHVRKYYHYGNYAWIFENNSNGSVSNIKVRIIGHDSFGNPLVRVLNNLVAKQSGRNEYIPSKDVYSSRSNATAVARRLGLKDESLSRAIKAVHHNHIKKHRAKHYINNAEQDNIARKEDLKLTNQDRASVGVSPLQEDSTLDQLAQYRSQQAIKNFSHVNANGKPYTNIDAPKFGLPWYFACAGNLAEAIGNNGKDAAKSANKEWWNGEKGDTPDQDGGHRKNIRSTDSTLIGIGATYSPKNQMWYFAQDYGDTNPDSSQNINGNDSYYGQEPANFVPGDN